MFNWNKKKLEKEKNNNPNAPAGWNGAHCEKQIVKAFIHNEIHYFTFADIADLPNERAIYAVRYFQENEMKCDLDYLKTHALAVKTAINAKDFYKLTQLNSDLDDRTEWLFEPSIILKCASLVYFDATENPNRFVESFAKEKIKRWIEGGLTDFFLHLPIKALFPKMVISLDSDTDTQNYLSLTTKKQLNQLMKLYEVVKQTSTSTTISSFLASSKTENLDMLKQLT